LSDTLERVRALVARQEVRISVHGYEELAVEGIQLRDVISGLEAAEVVEDYPDYHKGPCVLVLQRDGSDQPIHVLWGIPAGRPSPAVVITAYRPNPQTWDGTWKQRRA
jgi:hypothetical protein